MNQLIKMNKVIYIDPLIKKITKSLIPKIIGNLWVWIKGLHLTAL